MSQTELKELEPITKNIFQKTEKEKQELKDAKKSYNKKQRKIYGS
jgi:hypothetical protein